MIYWITLAIVAYLFGYKCGYAKAEEDAKRKEP